MLDPKHHFASIVSDLAEVSDRATFRIFLSWSNNSNQKVVESHHSFLSTAKSHEDYCEPRIDRIQQCLKLVSDQLHMGAEALPGATTGQIPLPPQHPGRLFGKDFWSGNQHHLDFYDDVLSKSHKPPDYSKPNPGYDYMSARQLASLCGMVAERKQEMDAWQMAIQRFQIDAARVAIGIEKALRSPIATFTSEVIMGDKTGSTQNVNYGQGNTFHGNATVAGTLKDSLNQISGMPDSNPAKAELTTLLERIAELEARLEGLDDPKLRELLDDASNLTKEASRSEPNQGILAGLLGRMGETARVIGSAATPVVEAVVKLTPLIKHFT